MADDETLYAPSVEFDQKGGRAYDIQDWARIYLKEHIDVVGGTHSPNKNAQGDS